MKVAAIIEYGPDKEQVKAHHSKHGEYLRRFLGNEQLRAAGPLADDAGALWIYKSRRGMRPKKSLKATRILQPEYLLGGKFILSLIGRLKRQWVTSKNIAQLPNG